VPGKFISNGHLLRKNASRAAVRLFCFPYAGGGAYVFRPWARILNASVEICPVQLPGREARMKEPFARDLRALVLEIAGEIQHYLDKPFAFFGHSMGAIMAFELARCLRGRLRIEPLQLFVSGRRAPQLPRREQPIFNLPEHELITELRRLNGTPEEVLRDRGLLEMMLPLVRADLEMVECYQYAPGLPLSCPVAAFGGLEDEEVLRDDLAGWSAHTTSQFSLHMFPGGHFFIKTAESLLLEQLSTYVEDLLIHQPQREP
jgi:medium-chain acyl-[acyl-carrier-protein] hydrolase